LLNSIPDQSALHLWFMKPKKSLRERVIEAAEAALDAQNEVSPIDVLVGIGWLYPRAPSEWRQGRIDVLLSVVQAHPERLSEAMSLLRSWAAARGLVPRETDYVARQPHRQKLRFSATGDEATETVYRTHWVSGALSEKQRERQAAKANRAPELVVIEPLKQDWTCHRCGGSDGLLVMEKPGPACLRCAGLDDLEVLPAGDALLTRRVKAKSGRHAVIVRFSRTRRRYERQGLLVEPQILADARRELGWKE
jgi:hypothetical protein